MTEQQKHNEHIPAFPIKVEIVPEDIHDADVALMNEVGRHMLADLTHEGYQVEPVGTGQRGT